MKKLVFFVCGIAIIFSACTSLQKDVSHNVELSHLELNLGELETRIIPLEALGGAEARKRPDELKAVRALIDGMRKDAAAAADYSGKLIAWSGRLAILEGRYSEAQRLYRESQAVSPGNLPSIILGLRLEGDPGKRLELIEDELRHTGYNPRADGFGELHIEKAAALLELRRYDEAAGAFDSAFASGMDDVYQRHYQDAREKAWELRNAGGAASAVLDVLERGGLTWRDAIALAKNETRLLRFITAGREISEAELLTRLSERAFIPYTQDIALTEWPRAALPLNGPVLRSGAAWFLWHLYAEARADRGLLSRYSSRYATGTRPRSPIADLPVLSPFFDSIVGCVETELMSLPDGRNFNPTDQMRAAELLAILKRIDN